MEAQEGRVSVQGAQIVGLDTSQAFCGSELRGARARVRRRAGRHLSDCTLGTARRGDLAAMNREQIT